MTIIGLLGKKRSGKDTAADYLASNNKNIIKTAYAAPLKDACKLLFNLTDDQVNGDSKETQDDYWKVSPRQILQFVGTDLFRKEISKLLVDINIQDKFWTENLKKRYVDDLNKNKSVIYIVSDVRFQNEVDLIHELGGKIIKISRDSIDNIQDQHVSEKNIDLITNYDFLIQNNSTLDDFYNNINKINILI